MGITAFWYATKGTIDEVEARCRKVWPDVFSPLQAEHVSSTDPLGLLWDRPADLVMWTHGEWVIWCEKELGLYDEVAFGELGMQSPLYHVFIADHGGSYGFMRCADGVERVVIDDIREGTELPEELPLKLKKSVDEADVLKLWTAFGLPDPMTSEVPCDCRVFVPRAVTDSVRPKVSKAPHVLPLWPGVLLAVAGAVAMIAVLWYLLR